MVGTLEHAGCHGRLRPEAGRLRCVTCRGWVEDPEEIVHPERVTTQAIQLAALRFADMVAHAEALSLELES